jgi:hypothetical protein
MLSTFLKTVKIAESDSQIVIRHTLDPIIQENPPFVLVRYADCLLSPFAKGDYGHSAHCKFAKGGFCSTDNAVLRIKD